VNDPSPPSPSPDRGEWPGFGAEFTEIDHIEAAPSHKLHHPTAAATSAVAATIASKHEA
jgi:hypothetical protein